MPDETTRTVTVAEINALVASWHHESRFGDPAQMALWGDRMANALSSTAALVRASRTRPDYDLRCTDCGAPHWFDTSLPSVIWNQIAVPGDLLCLLCIDARMEKAGLQYDEAEFYFVGKALNSKAYAESHGELAERDRRIAALEAEREEIEKALEVFAAQDRTMTPWPSGWMVDYTFDEPSGPPTPTALSCLLAWHRARGATQEGTDG